MAKESKKGLILSQQPVSVRVWLLNTKTLICHAVFDANNLLGPIGYPGSQFANSTDAKHTDTPPRAWLQWKAPSSEPGTWTWASLVCSDGITLFLLIKTPLSSHSFHRKKPSGHSCVCSRWLSWTWNLRRLWGWPQQNDVWCLVFDKPRRKRRDGHTIAGLAPGLRGPAGTLDIS